MTYVLLTLVVGIWGYVIYTIFAKVGDHDVAPIRAAYKPVAADNLGYYRWKDSLPFDTIYSSPFLVSAVVEQPQEATPTMADPYPPVEQYDPMAFAPAMDIQYLGFIENEQQKHRVAIVQINGKQYYLRPKQSVEGVTLLQVSANNIKVKTDYQTLTINK